MNVILRKNHWVLPFLMLERPVGSQWTRLGSKNFQRCLKHVLSDSLDLELIRMLGHSAVVIREGECASSSTGDDPHGLPVPLRGEPSIKDLVGAQILVVDISRFELSFIRFVFRPAIDSQIFIRASAEHPKDFVGLNLLNQTIATCQCRWSPMNRRVLFSVLFSLCC